MKQRNLGASIGAMEHGRLSPYIAAMVAIFTVLAVVTPAPAMAATGSLISGVAWADTALNQTRPATGAVTKSGVTVQLVTPGTNAVVATTTTDANGNYSFANVADGSYQVLVTAPAFMKFPTSLTANSNKFVSTGAPSSSTDPYQGISQTVTISGATQITNEDAGLQPIATLNVQPLAQPGYNCANGSGDMVAQTDLGNCVTSTLSNVSQAFAVSVSNLGTGQTVNNVIATFTFTPLGGAVLTMPSLPQGCQTTGVTPASSVSGNLVLTCNLGAVNSAQIIAVKPIVVPTASSPNGSSFSTSLSARAGDGTAVNSNTATNPVITISGKPNYNTDKTIVSNAGAGTYTVNGQPQLGYQITYLIRGYPQTAIGSATLALPLTIPDAGISQFPNAVITACLGPSVWQNQNLTPVQNCPTNRTASAASPWNLTFTNYAPSGQQCVNLGGIVCFNTGTNNYATQITVFVPAADVNRAANPAWQPGDPPPTGTVNFQNCLGNGVDGKVDNTGQLNNGNGVMGGQRCVSSSFAVAQGFPSPITAFKHYNINGTETTDGYFVGPGEPNVQSHMQYVNTSTIADPNFSMCDYFDVSTMELTATTPVTTQNLPAGFRVEYGVAPNTIDVQVGPPATNGTYPKDPVYKYSNTDQNTIGTNCNRYTGQWATDPTTFGADWQQKVNLVRIAPIPGFTPTPAAPANSTIQFYLNFTVQSVYNGGPHAGQTIPTGAYIPNVGSWDNGPLDPTFANQTAKVYYKQVLPKNVTGSKSYAYGNPSYGTGGAVGFNGNGNYTNAGATLLSFVGYNNIGPSPDYDAMICDYFDVSTMRLNSAGLVRPTNNGNGSTGIAAPAGFRIEYGVAPNTVDPQVGTPTVGNGYAGPIYQYSNTDQQSGALNCKTLNANWTTAPATAFGANWQNVVNIVRLAPIPGFTPTPQIQAGWFGYLDLNLTLRASYNGGPHNGAPIPQGAYIPNVGSWDTPQNTAAPVSTQTATVAYLAYQLGLDKTVNTGVSYQPGSQVQWQITPKVTQGVAQRQITGVTVTDVVPANTVYDSACTNAALPPRVTATLNLTTNTVTFNYANTYTVNAVLPQNLPTVMMCTDILSTVNPGIQISNSAKVTSNEAPASVTSNTATITVGGAGRLAISKSVSKPVISSGETYSWGLRWTNNSPVAFAAPEVIDVLPYDGDGSSGASSDRLTGSSSFAGTNVLTGALAQPTYAAGSTSTGPAAGTWYYTTATPTSIQQNPGDPSNQNPGTAGSIWVPAAQVTTWAQVTGVFFSSTGFLNSGDTVTATIPQQANNGNQLGDIYVNQAELWSSSAPNNPVVTNNPYTQIPGITIVKQASPATVTQAGQTVTYTFTVANQGRVSVSNVSVADTQAPPSLAASLSPITCVALTSPAASCSGTVVPTLAGGQVARFTATYTVTQADVDNGTISDSAVGNALTNPGGEPITSAPSTAVVSATPAPAVSLVKTSLTGSVSNVGDVITYNFRVTNTGNVTLHGISVSDQQVAPAGPLTSGPTCPTGSVAPGAFVDCTATYTVSQADLDAGSINDTATAAGISPTNATVRSPQSSAIVPATQTPTISLVKSVTSPTGPVSAVGDMVTYNFHVTNTGNVTLHSITVADQQLAPAGALTSGPTCPTGSLAPAASTDCTATYTVTQADLDNGSINDTATAAGLSPTGTTVQSPQSAASVPVTQTGSLDLVKSVVSPTGPVSAVGDVITYKFHVTNTGNVTLTKIAVADQQAAPAGSLTTGPTCPPGSLAPGASMDCAATYTVTQADLDAQPVGGTVAIRDTATASGTTPTNVTVSSPERSLSVPVTQITSISVVKSSPDIATPVTHVGQTIRYQFVATNTGNVTLTNVGITDTPVAPADPANLSAITCPQTTLTPGEQMICTATYTVGQPDLDHGDVVNGATSHGTPPTGPAVESPVSKVSVPEVEDPHLTVEKSSPTTLVTAAGQLVPYAFTVTNTGNVTIDNVAVTDQVASAADLSPVLCPNTTLIPGQSTTCTATYAATQDEVDKGSVNDTARASGTDPQGTNLPSNDSSVSIPARQDPTLDIVKATTTGSVTAVGQQIPYTFTVTNTGNVTLKSVEVTDTVASPSDPENLSAISCPDADLTPNGVFVCTATYTTTQKDLDNGSVNDTATVTAKAPDGTTVHGNESRVSVPVTQTSGLTVQKTSTTTGITKVGQPVPYTFTVTNIGNVTVSGITVSDTVAAPSDPTRLSPVECPATSLGSGDHMDCTATYTVTQADFDHGSVTDQATASGTDPHGKTADTDGPSPLTIPVTRHPGLSVVKSTTTTMVTALGQQVPYTFTVTNTGDTTLAEVSVRDALSAPSEPSHLSPITCVTVTGPDASCSGTTVTLAPGQVATFTATYTAAQPDLNFGSVSDTASATGTDPNGTTIMSKNPSTVTIPAQIEHMPAVSG